MSTPTSIRMTKRELNTMKRQLLRDLGVTEEEFRAKAASSEPLTNKEYSAMNDLSMIDFLLGDDGA